MKNIIVIVLVVLGLYWLLDHTGPFLSHESFGLYAHSIHRIIGVVLLIVAALVAWKWKGNNRSEN
jgi:hypothetical protein